MAFLTYIETSLFSAFSILAMGLLPWICVALLFQFVSNLLRGSLARIFGLRGYVYLTIPGVAVHELSHALFCLLFGHKVVKMVLFSLEEDGTLGYVHHTYNPKSYYQRIGNFFIGTGPIWGGIFVLFIASKILLPPEMLPLSPNFTDDMRAFLSGFFSIAQWSSWKRYLWLYLALTIGSHVTLSKPDLSGALDGLLMMVGVVLFACLCFGWCGNWPAAVVSGLKCFILGQLTPVGTVLGLLIIFAILLRMLPFGHSPKNNGQEPQP